MTFLRKAGSIVGRTAHSRISRETSLSMSSSMILFEARMITDHQTCRSRGFGLPRSCKNGVSKTQRRHKSSLVGTSEAIRETTYPKSFCEWLAGIIDGDGSIQVSKKGHTSLEITMGFEDLQLLRYVQHMLGGGIKMRAGATSYRYRLHNHLGMIKLMSCINGHIRHSARLVQLHRACQELEIPVILPIPLDTQSSWFAGFFDADGTITLDTKHGLPQLSIGVTNKLLQDVESFKVAFGGSVYFDSGRNGYYQWSIHSREDVIMMLDYFKSNTFRSHKSRRFFLIKEYYRLYDLEAFKPDSIHHKAWLAFQDKWNRLMISRTQSYTTMAIRQMLRRSLSSERRSSEVPKGHVAVYVGDNGKKHFVVRVYHPSFQELLFQAKEEFGFHHPVGRLTIPCSEDLFSDVVSGLRRT